MSVTVASGITNQSGTYIPEKWEPRIQIRFYANSVVWD